jgi:hypothetical protein
MLGRSRASTRPRVASAAGPGLADLALGGGRLAWCLVGSTVAWAQVPAVTSTRLTVAWSELTTSTARMMLRR